jgi:hypothetical protein
MMQGWKLGQPFIAQKALLNGITIIKVLTLVQDIFTLATTEVKEVSNGPSEHQIHVIEIEVSCFGMSISL